MTDTLAKLRDIANGHSVFQNVPIRVSDLRLLVAQAEAAGRCRELAAEWGKVTHQEHVTIPLDLVRQALDGTAPAPSEEASE